MLTFYLYYYCFMYMGVLPICKPVHQVCACCPQRQEGNGSYRTRFMDGCEIPRACWELSSLSNPKCWHFLKSIYVAFQLSTKHFCWYIRLGVSPLGSVFISSCILSVTPYPVFLISSYMFRSININIHPVIEV